MMVWFRLRLWCALFTIRLDKNKNIVGIFNLEMAYVLFGDSPLYCDSKPSLAAALVRIELDTSS